MWDNPRALNMAAGMLVGLAALAFAAVALLALLRSELFPVREIVVQGALARTARAELEDAVRGRVGGNFFAASPGEVRRALEQLPWIRRVEVRRAWPDRLEVRLEEHVALARWGEHNENPQLRALVNTYGERFNGASDAVLPMFIAPAGTEAELARRYARFAEVTAPLGVSLERVVLTPRLAWQLRLGNGLQVMLGRDGAQAEARLARFVEAYGQTLARVARHHDYVDLRYPNGFALRVPDLAAAGRS
ncbi:MAG: cell division protein FtsQ/DivIB [Betaproteobacteria bacterium]